MAQAFISWSGPQARKKAAALRKLIGDVLPEAGVFMSDEDISAGSLWLTSVSGSLDDSVAGVIIVTPENLRNPWVHYEAGALATRVESRVVIPLLSGLTPDELANTPLSIFQARVLDKSSILEVCTSFAAALGIVRSKETIVRAFEKWWDDYADDLLAVPVSLAKPAITLEDLHRLVSSMQGQLRAQTELLTSLVRPATEPRHQAPSSATMTPSFPPATLVSAAREALATNAFAGRSGSLDDTSAIRGGVRVSSILASDVLKSLGTNTNTQDAGIPPPPPKKK